MSDKVPWLRPSDNTMYWVTPEEKAMLEHNTKIGNGVAIPRTGWSPTEGDLSFLHHSVPMDKKLYDEYDELVRLGDLDPSEISLNRFLADKLGYPYDPDKKPVD